MIDCEEKNHLPGCLESHSSYSAHAGCQVLVASLHLLESVNYNHNAGD